MSRLIDADALIKRIPSVMDMQDVYLPIHFKELLIDEAPTVDAVPVVRCEQCTWWYMGECMFWAGSGMYTENYDYCSRGKRIEK